MSHELDPKVGRWYRRLDDEEIFKVVSIDEDDGLVEIRTEDGELEELDATEWVELDLEAAEPPEDYVDPDEGPDDDEDEDEAEVEAVEPEESERPKPGRPSRAPRESWDEDDEDDEDFDDDDDDDEDYDSDR